MDLGPHAVFIVSAYIGVVAATVVLIGRVALSSMRVKARLAALEAQGIRRRSAGGPNPTSGTPA
jgi:heme exporter protein D